MAIGRTHPLLGGSGRRTLTADCQRESLARGVPRYPWRGFLSLCSGLALSESSLCVRRRSFAVRSLG